MAKVNTTPPRLSLYEILEFWQHVDRTAGQGPNGDCWEWTLKRDIGGYGHLFIRFPQWRHLKASRFAFYLANDYWPSAFVLHRCDNPPYCNPKHLFEGTDQRNMDDARAKNRLAIGDRHWTKQMPHRVPQGSQRGQAKLTESEVRQILIQLSKKQPKQKIAQAYNVSVSLIHLIAKRKIWRHVTISSLPPS